MRSPPPSFHPRLVNPCQAGARQTHRQFPRLHDFLSLRDRRRGSVGETRGPGSSPWGQAEPMPVLQLSYLSGAARCPENQVERGVCVVQAVSDQGTGMEVGGVVICEEPTDRTTPSTAGTVPLSPNSSAKPERVPRCRNLFHRHPEPSPRHQALRTPPHLPPSSKTPPLAEPPHPAPSGSPRETRIG